jgi:hypothetical protein
MYINTAQVYMDDANHGWVVDSSEWHGGRRSAGSGIHTCIHKYTGPTNMRGLENNPAHVMMSERERGVDASVPDRVTN